jgi:hypothetical protein
VINNRPERGQTSPNEKAGAKVVDMYSEFHPALCHALYKIPNVHVPNKMADKAMEALWCGRSSTVPGGHVLLPIEWNGKTGMWEVGSQIISSDVRVDRTRFPLRLRPAKGCNVRELDTFLDQFHPDVVEPVAYVVQKIINKRTVDGEEQYYVKWAGFNSSQNTWEPANHFNAGLWS